MPKICIIIPVYNEALRLPTDDYLNHLKAYPNHYILFVNDGSKDNSLDILMELNKQNKLQIKVINQQQNKGKAQTIRKGVQESFKWMDFDYFGFMDADLATPLFQIDFLINQFNDNLILVFGSRIKLLINKIERNTTRHYMGRIFATFVSILFQLKIYDTQCGAKFFRTSDFSLKLFENPFISKWFFDIEIFLRLRKQGNQFEFQQIVNEVPLQEWIEKGNTKLSLSDFIFTPFLLVKLKIKAK